MINALKRVETNKCAPDIDGMEVHHPRKYLKDEGEYIKYSLLDSTYETMLVRQVKIPKPDGGTRILGVPKSIDRMI